MKLTLTAVENIPMVEPGDDLIEQICAGLDSMNESLLDGDILVLAQKIVSKAENRYVDLKSVVPSADIAGTRGSRRRRGVKSYSDRNSRPKRTPTKVGSP